MEPPARELPPLQTPQKGQPVLGLDQQYPHPPRLTVESVLS